MLEWGAKRDGLVPILLDGHQVALVDPEFWREGAELQVAGQTWIFGRDGRDRVARLAGSDVPVLRAAKTGFWGSSWTVEGEGVRYEVKPQGFTGRTHVVLRDGRQVGSGDPATFWSGRATLVLDDSVPPAHQLFLLWISHIIRRRAAAAAASSS